jgi:hypothetical protein
MYIHCNRVKASVHGLVLFVRPLFFSLNEGKERTESIGVAPLKYIIERLYKSDFYYTLLPILEY